MHVRQPRHAAPAVVQSHTYPNRSSRVSDLRHRYRGETQSRFFIQADALPLTKIVTKCWFGYIIGKHRCTQCRARLVSTYESPTSAKTRGFAVLHRLPSRRSRRVNRDEPRDAGAPDLPSARDPWQARWATSRKRHACRICEQLAGR